MTSPEYLNPVYPYSFPDPFVLKFRGEYWAYCTGDWPDGCRFGILHSRDLVHWNPLAGAMERLPGDATCYWAPEVVYDNGRFYLYYSVGNEETMEIRVAVADHPAGPFVDSGRRLTSEPFAIDAHVFVDDDGSRHLFYATDFLDRSHIGTGTVRDRMLDPFTLAGEPAPVALPRHDWHVYHPNRPEKGFVRWHTVEGPFILKRKGLYYEMFSGGNWQNPTYGVSYAVTDRLDRPEEWTQAADGERVLPILRTLEGQVVGPGHNSVVRGPDNRQLFCVYHRWIEEAAGQSARALAIDPLDWAGERMLVLGPSTGPRPAPEPPTFTDFFDGPLAPGWDCRGGRWESGGGAAAQREPGASGEARFASKAESFLVEVSVRALEPSGRQSGFGVGLWGDVDLLRLLLTADGAAVYWRGRGPWFERELTLPSDFDPAAFHLVRIEVDGLRVSLALDGLPAWEGRLAGPCAGVSLLTEQMAAEFSGFALTAGWEDLFTGDLQDSGWEAPARLGEARAGAAPRQRRDPRPGAGALLADPGGQRAGGVGRRELDRAARRGIRAADHRRAGGGSGREWLGPTEPRVWRRPRLAAAGRLRSVRGSATAFPEERRPPVDRVGRGPGGGDGGPGGASAYWIGRPGKL